MASEKQVAANRENAKRSTGPKTVAGKALSRINAYKHGLTAKAIVIPGEDPKAFDLLRAELEEEYDPRPGIESKLVERLAVLMWRMRRIPMFETGLIELRRRQAAAYERQARMLCGPFDAEGEDDEEKRPPYESTALALVRDSDNQDTLGKLLRYEVALMNQFGRTLQQLLFLQDRRARDDHESKVVDVLSTPANGGDAASQ